MQATALTLMTGKRLEVIGTYDDVELTLRPRNLSETGTREFTRTDGRRIKIALNAVVTTEELTTTTTKTKLGFVKD